jgi:biotin synthase
VVNEFSQPEILQWLRESRPSPLQDLYVQADAARREHVGDAVHLRGLIEVSSHCQRQCMYCGLRRSNIGLARYRMTREEICVCVREAVRLGYGTVVLQAGEDDALTADWIADIVRWIKCETPLAVTLSLGERTGEEMRLWREAGADRYLLRFETSDLSLFRTIHPERHRGAPDRIALLQRIKELGYETGGGVMVGIPGQSFESLAQDVLMFRALDLDMIGIGPYIAHPATPLGSGVLQPPIEPHEQVPNSEEMVCRMIALTRLVCPSANIPSTTALATINKIDGRKHGLLAGANVVMPNLTPVQHRSLYQIYPEKACIEESATECNQCLRGQVHSLGRFIGQGQGSRGEMEVAPRMVSESPSQFVQLQVPNYAV